MVGGGHTAAQSAVGDTVIADPSEPSVPSKPDAVENVGSVASGVWLSAAVRTLPDIRNQEESHKDSGGYPAREQSREGVTP